MLTKEKSQNTNGIFSSGFHFVCHKAQIPLHLLYVNTRDINHTPP
jgi:hypothetical protein